jgi:hypothetical protein
MHIEVWAQPSAANYCDELQPAFVAMKQNEFPDVSCIKRPFMQGSKKSASFNDSPHSQTGKTIRGLCDRSQRKRERDGDYNGSLG